MTQPLPGLQVDANKVINILKARLLDEISKTAMLEAALQDSQEREQLIAAQLHAQTAEATSREQALLEQLDLPREKKEDAR